MKVTLLYAGLLTLWYLVLSIRVVQGRMGKGRPSLGDGGDAMMLRRIRGHANFSEYVPLILVVMALLESDGLLALGVHIIGATLLLARLLHGYTFSFRREWVLGRTAGASLTFLALAAAGVAALIRSL